jgi:hypothetical protein
MVKRLLHAAVMAALFAGVGSALAQGFGESEAERTGKLYRNTIGFGSGAVISIDHAAIELSFQKAIGQNFRIEIAGQYNMTWSLPADWDSLINRHPQVWMDAEEGSGGFAMGYGALASFQYRHSISGDGFFNAYGGPLVSYLSVSGSSGDYRIGNSYFGGRDFSGNLLGIGAIIGIEWDFSNRIQTANVGAFQVKYRTDYCISLDIRPVYNVVRPYTDYHPFQIGLGFSGRYMF